MLLTGPQAAGKTTVARLLAARFERGVHLEGDVFRRFIDSGRVVVLMPSREAIALREAERQAKGYGTWSIEQLYRVFEADTPGIGLWLDTSNQSAEETVDAILGAIE